MKALPIPDWAVERFKLLYKTRDPDSGCEVLSGRRCGGFKRRHLYVAFGGDRQFLARRLAWTAAFGPLQPRDLVSNSCGNPACIAEKHLKLTSHVALSREARLKKLRALQWPVGHS